MKLEICLEILTLFKPWFLNLLTWVIIMRLWLILNAWLYLMKRWLRKFLTSWCDWIMSVGKMNLKPFHVQSHTINFWNLLKLMYIRIRGRFLIIDLMHIWWRFIVTIYNLIQFYSAHYRHSCKSCIEHFQGELILFYNRIKTNTKRELIKN